MKASDVLSEIRQVLKETKGQGHSTVSIDAMENYLKLFDKDVENDTYYKSLNHEAQLAKFKAENDSNIAHSNNETAHAVEMFKSVVNAGQSALKASIFLMWVSYDGLGLKVFLRDPGEADTAIKAEKNV